MHFAHATATLSSGLDSLRRLGQRAKRPWLAWCRAFGAQLLALMLLLAFAQPLGAQCTTDQTNVNYHVVSVTAGGFSHAHKFFKAGDLTHRDANNKVYGPYTGSPVPPAADPRMLYPALGNPALVSMAAGGTFKVGLNTPTLACPASVTLIAVAGGPDVNASFTPTGCNGGNFTLTVTVPAGTPAGLYNLLIRFSDSTNLPALAMHAVHVSASFPSAYKFVLLSDIHIGNPVIDTNIVDSLKDYHVADLLSVLEAIERDEKPAFIVFTGDCTNGTGAYSDTYDHQYQALVWAILQRCRRPAFLTPGNHDQGWPHTVIGPGDLSAFKKWINPGSMDFSFDYGPDHFVMVNSGWGGDMLDGLTGAQVQWMAQDIITNAGNKRSFAFSHAPVVTDTLGTSKVQMRHHYITPVILDDRDEDFIAWWLQGYPSWQTPPWVAGTKPNLVAWFAGHTHKAEEYVVTRPVEGAHSKTGKPGILSGTHTNSERVVVVTASSTDDATTTNNPVVAEVARNLKIVSVLNSVLAGSFRVDGIICPLFSGTIRLSGDGGITYPHTATGASGSWSADVTLVPGTQVITAKAEQVNADGTVSSNLATASVIQATESFYGRMTVGNQVAVWDPKAGFTRLFYLANVAADSRRYAVVSYTLDANQSSWDTVQIYVGEASGPGIRSGISGAMTSASGLFIYAGLGFIGSPSFADLLIAPDALPGLWIDTPVPGATVNGTMVDVSPIYAGKGIPWRSDPISAPFKTDTLKTLAWSRAEATGNVSAASASTEHAVWLMAGASPGTRTLNVTLTDLFGRAITRSVTVNYDASKPFYDFRGPLGDSWKGVSMGIRGNPWGCSDSYPFIADVNFWNGSDPYGQHWAGSSEGKTADHIRSILAQYTIWGPLSTATSPGTTPVFVVDQAQYDNDSLGTLPCGGGPVSYREVYDLLAAMLGKDSLGNYRVWTSNGGIRAPIPCLHLPKPAPPTYPAATQTSATINWANLNGESGYQLQRLNGSTWTTVATLAPDVTTYTNTGLTPNTTYSYRIYVQGITPCGDQASDASSITTLNSDGIQNGNFDGSGGWVVSNPPYPSCSGGYQTNGAFATVTATDGPLSAPRYGKISGCDGPTGQQSYCSSLSQTFTVPADACSLKFALKGGGYSSVSLGSTTIPLTGGVAIPLPYYPSPGSETVINEPGHYRGYFANWCPGQGMYEFVPAPGWVVNSCALDGVGTHGGCAGCAMVLVDLSSTQGAGWYQYSYAIPVADRGQVRTLTLAMTHDAGYAHPSHCDSVGIDNVRIIRPTAPAAPTFSNITTSTVTMSWPAVNGAESYELYLYRGGYWYWDSTTGTTYTWYGLPPSTSCEIYVRATFTCVNAWMALEGPHAVVTTACVNPSAPGVPSASNITATSVTLNWTAAANAGTYAVERSTVDSSGVYNAWAPLQPFYPSPGTETVVNEPGHYQGYFAAYCPGTPPYGFTPAAGWTVNSCAYYPTGSHGGCAGCAMVLIDLTFASSTVGTTFTDTSVTPATTYKYRIVAGALGTCQNTIGPESAAVTTLCVNPGTPGTPTLTSLGRIVTVTWPGAANATSYRIERASYSGTACGAFTSVGTTPASETSFVDTTAPGNTTQCYRIVAVAAGTCTSSTGSSATISVPPAGMLAATGSLANARSLHTATQLPNGKVLIVGGSSYSVAELYDPATGTFAATGSLVMARRYSHTATLLPNGKVLIAGGYNTTTLNNAELYDPATGTFTATGSLVQRRYGHTATLLPNGKVLIAAGINDPNALASAELYDPATGTFTTTGSLATARYNHSATLLPNGKVLIAGGYNGTALTSAELFNPATGAFAATGSLAAARSAHSATLLPNGKVLIAGGSNGTSNLASSELYDPAAGTFAATGSLAAARQRHSATLLPNGKVLLAAGGTYGAALASAELYDPATGTYKATGSLATARYNFAAVLMSNGKVLIGGGYNTSSLTNAELYDPQDFDPFAAAPRPVGWWKLDEGPGNTLAYDSSFLGNLGVLVNNPAWVAGKRGQALSFNGTNQYVTTPDCTPLRLQGDFTVSSWVYINGGIANWASVVSKGAVNARNYFLGYYGTTGEILFKVWDGANVLRVGTTAGTVANPIYLQTGRWYLLTAVKQGGTASVYADGTLVASAPIAFTPPASADPLTLGYDVSGGYFHNGLLDDVRIYDIALSASQIQELASLVGYWRLDGTTADSSGYGNTGSPVNSPTWVSGKFGSAVNLNGSNQYVALNNLNVNTAASAKNTVAFWMYWDGTSGKMPFGWSSYDLWFSGGYFGFNTGTSDIWGISSSGLANRWVHVAAVFYNGMPDATNLELYIDGVKQTISRVVGTASTSRTVSTGARIGVWNNDTSYCFGGQIDEVRIYDTALSAVQIQALASLVGRWGLDGSTTDTSCYGNTGTPVNSPAWVTGKMGQALSFNGTNQYVTVPDSPSLRITRYTVAVWIKPNGVPNEGWKGIVGKPGRNFNIWLNSGGYIHHRFHNAASTNAGAADTPAGSIAWDAWNHVVITNDGTTARTYINGVEKASGPAGGEPIVDASTLILGKNLDDPAYLGNLFNGLIDEVRIYNKALSVAEISALAAGGF